jgi:hypothetical protein
LFFGLVRFSLINFGLFSELNLTTTDFGVWTLMLGWLLMNENPDEFETFMGNKEGCYS